MRSRRLLAHVIVVLVVTETQALAQGTAADYERAANLRALVQNKVFKAGVVPLACAEPVWHVWLVMIFVWSTMATSPPGRRYTLSPD